VSVESEPIGTSQAWPVESSESLRRYERARRVIPGGVEGEGRSYAPYPLYVQRAAGSRMWDVDGNEYVDFHAAFGAILLGHDHPSVVDAIASCVHERGIAYSAAHPLEAELAEQVIALVPSAEMVVFSCTGSEATYHAIRLARATTGREKILKFEGHYHGWHDYVNWSVHVGADEDGGDSMAPIALPGSAGIPRALDETVVIAQYNEPEALERLVSQHGSQLAALIVEPIFINAGVILPEPGFLELCRELCDRYGIVLVFDEIITGFRVAPGGAQQLVGVSPDLTTLGKAIANGMPVSAVAGRRALLERFTPTGDAFFSGTFYGQTLGVAAALACTRFLAGDPEVYTRLEELGTRLGSGLQAAADEVGAKVTVATCGSIWSLFFRDTAPRTYREAAAVAKNTGPARDFQRWLLANGVYVHPHYMIRGYFTDAHSADDADRVVELGAQFFERYAAAAHGGSG
jgi:glutamate-1-semialdehyde 2,1-aminomutase